MFKEWAKMAASVITDQRSVSRGVSKIVHSAYRINKVGQVSDSQVS